MYKFDLNRIIKIHFIGIGGISMSGIAELLLDRGFSVSGSDITQSPITERLSGLGARIAYGHHAENIPDGTELVVFTAAIHPDNPEYCRAVDEGIPLLDRATLLGQIMSYYSNAVAVAGTHGKTTTTSMLSYVYLEAGMDPTITVGGILKGIEGNLRIGHSDSFIMEACEYTNSFLRFRPTTAIVLNIEEDHMDFFHDLEDIRSSFQKFMELLPDDGLLVINTDIPDWEPLTGRLNCRVATYGFSDTSDYTAEQIEYDGKGCAHYDLLVRGVLAGHIVLSVAGLHNVSNSLAVAAAALEKGISFGDLAAALLSFKGTDRRFQQKGEFNGVSVIDDYAHHPTEIRLSLTAAKRCQYKNIWCVFQPHTYTRTKAFLNEFAEALSLSDKVVLADIYAAREPDTGEVSSRDLRDKLLERGVECYYFPNFEEIEVFLKNNCNHGDLLITMGAGDVVKIGESLLQG